MNLRRNSLVLVSSILLGAVLAGPTPAAAKESLKGAAILAHACGQTALKHMGLVHAGKIDDAVRLGTQEMQDQWKSMPADDKKMMSGMMKAMSQSEDDFMAEIKADGQLVVDGKTATLTVTKKTQDANGSSTETMTQNFAIDAKGCWITH